MENILLTAAAEIETARNGEMPSETYSDGEIYVFAHDLSRWRNEQPVAVLEASAGIAP